MAARESAVSPLTAVMPVQVTGLAPVDRCDGAAGHVAAGHNRDVHSSCVAIDDSNNNSSSADRSLKILYVADVQMLWTGRQNGTSNGERRCLHEDAPCPGHARAQVGNCAPPLCFFPLIGYLK